MHFLKDIVLVGFDSNISQWNSIFPISQDKFLENSKNKEKPINPINPNDIIIQLNKTI